MQGKEEQASERRLVLLFPEIFIQGVKYFSIELRSAVLTEKYCIYTALQFSAYTRRKWNNIRGPPGPDVSAQMCNTSDSGGFLLCLTQKASML